MLNMEDSKKMDVENKVNIQKVQKRRTKVK